MRVKRMSMVCAGAVLAVLASCAKHESFPGYTLRYEAADQGTDIAYLARTAYEVNGLQQGTLMDLAGLPGEASRVARIRTRLPSFRPDEIEWAVSESERALSIVIRVPCKWRNESGTAFVFRMIYTERKVESGTKRNALSSEGAAWEDVDPLEIDSGDVRGIPPEE